MKKSILSTLLAAALLAGLLGGCGAGTESAGSSSGSSASDSSASDSASVSAVETPEPVQTDAPASLSDQAEPEAAPTLEPAEAEAAAEPASGLTDGVTLGRSVFIHDSGVAFWCAENTLCTGLLDASGQLYDYYAEGELPARLWSVAVVGDDCVLGTSSGLLRFSLAEFEQGDVLLEKLTEEGVFEGFSIWDGSIYYRSGDELFCVPLTGGTERRVTSDISDFELTTAGIYYTVTSGGLCFMSYDGSQRTQLADTGKEAHLCLQGQNILYWSDADHRAFLWDLEAEAREELPLQAALASDEALWPVSEDSLIYTGDDDEVHRYTYADGNDTVLDALSVLPDKETGCLSNNVLYYCYSSSVYWDDLLTCQSGKAKLEDFAQPDTGTASAAPASTPTPTPASSSGGFDISNGLEVHTSEGRAVLTNDYFSLYLPADPAWAVEAVDANTLVFTYPPAADSGFGGQFLTIQAYDWGDNSYADLPSYSMAGQDADKKYVAIFPTDVRFDPNDSAQRDAYQVLSSAARQIDCNGNPENNPFFVLNP